ncbi:MAG: Zn-ribbon domain-containing OB-fold protein [Nitrospiria bacterium]
MRCLTCHQIGTEWVQVGPQGTLETWTIVRTSVPSIQVIPVPYAVGVIRLDGADSGLVHFLGGVEFSKLFSGLRIEPVFNPQRRGHILDIRYFQPVLTQAD